jgi:hypothetical protein
MLKIDCKWQKWQAGTWKNIEYIWFGKENGQKKIKTIFSILLVLFGKQTLEQKRRSC